jgi:hypothetical protein
MAINIKLSDAVPIEGSVLNRTWYGWKESASPQTIYESNRGVWPLGSRARHERYATFSYHGTIRVAVEIDRIEELPVDNPNKRRASGPRAPARRRHVRRVRGPSRSGQSPQPSHLLRRSEVVRLGPGHSRRAEAAPSTLASTRRLLSGQTVHLGVAVSGVAGDVPLVLAWTRLPPQPRCGSAA